MKKHFTLGPAQVVTDQLAHDYRLTIRLDQIGQKGGKVEWLAACELNHVQIGRQHFAVRGDTAPTADTLSWA